MANTRKVVKILGAVSLGILAVEAALQALCLTSVRVDNMLAISPVPDIPMSLLDESLGFRPNPDHPDHDTWGFRNASVPGQAAIVALGDSQTYGAGVAREEAWPQQLQQLSNVETYNLSFGGYGPTHSLLLMEKAISLKPRLIVEAFYSGNDLYDCFCFVRDRRQLPGIEPAAAEVVAAIKRAEARGPIQERVVTLFSPRKTGVRGILSRNSKIYGILRALKRAISSNDWNSIRNNARSSSGRLVPFESGELRTVLTPQYRLCGLDLDDPRISEGHRLALESIRRMHERAGEKGIRYLVLLVPTKELVFENAISTSGNSVGESYDALVKNEQRMWQRTTEYLKEQGIQFVDALPALSQTLARGDQPYPMSGDGHPNRLVSGQSPSKSVRP